MSGASCSPCFIGRSERSSTTTSSPSCSATVTSGVAVSKASSISQAPPGNGRARQCVVSATVVVEQVEGERGRPGLPDHGVGLVVQRDRRRAAAADQQRPAGERRRAGGVRVAHERGDRRAGASSRTCSSDSGCLSRIGAIRPTPMSPGGWCRETNAGRSSLPAGRRARRAGPRESSPWSIRWPSRRRHQRVQHQDPEVRGLEHLDQRVRGGLRVEQAAGERLADVVVAGADQLGAGPGVEDGARLGVLLGQSVVGDVAGHEEHVGPGVQREQVRHDRLGSRPGVGRPAEVGVADVGDERDHPSPLKESACQRGPTGVISHAAVSRRPRPPASPRMMWTSSRDSESPSASPSPHSTTVTACVEGGVEVEVVELVDAAEPVGVDVDQRRSPDLARGARGR